MSYGPPWGVFGGDRDDDARDGLSPWAHASRRRWEHNFRLEFLEPVKSRARTRNKRQRAKKCAENPAEGEPLSARWRAWEAKRLCALGLTDVPWDPEEACLLCNDDAPPPSGVRLRQSPTPLSEDEPPPIKKRPTLRLV